MKIRFVQGDPHKSIISFDIEARENVAMPFPPSHVEALSRDGAHYIGAHIDGGVRLREIGYDLATTRDELILDLCTSQDQDRLFHDYTESKLGEPYDWSSIVDYIMPVNWHQYNHVICSAFMTLALRKSNYFQWPLPWPTHLTSPRDLFGLIGAKMQIPGI